MICTHPDVMEIRRKSSTAIELDFCVPLDLKYLTGHFPGFPVVPGVVQIKWAVDFAARYLELADRSRLMKSIKFRQLMLPGQLVTLSLRWTSDRGSLNFEFSSRNGNHSSGRLELCQP